MPKQKWDSTGFGAKLKVIRERSGKSQQQLAEAVGVDVMTVSRLERGGQEPSWPLAIAIAKALGVDCAAFTETPSPDQAEPSPARPKKPDAAPAAGQEEATEKKPRKKKGGEK